MKLPFARRLLGASILGLAVLGLASGIGAQSLGPFRLAWDDPNPQGTVASYRVWRVTPPTAPSTATNFALLATTTAREWTINLPPGLHTVAVSAVGSDLVDKVESPVSTNKTVGVLVAVVNLKVTQ